MMQRLSHLPVIVDPSHAAGRRDLVVPLARAGMAAGADGVMVDVHPHPEAALCDGAQALFGDSLGRAGPRGDDHPAAAGPDLGRASGRLTSTPAAPRGPRGRARTDGG